MSALNEAQVTEIKLLLKLSNLTESDIANLYCVSFQTINNIKRKLVWTHVTISDEDRLDIHLIQTVEQINSNKKKPVIGVQEYILIKEYLKGVIEIQRS